MSYSPATVIKVIDKINTTYFLPAIQRAFVWRPGQVIALFDSLLKGYPFSSFLFWEIAPEHRTDWQIYKFAENPRYDVVHNELVEPDGREVVLVLDGQQRLTSLLIGLRGSYTIRSKYRRRDSPDSWSRQRLYIDLLKSKNTDDDEDSSSDVTITYGLRFSEEEPKSDDMHLWMKVGRILDCRNTTLYYQLEDELDARLPSNTPRAMRRVFKENLDNLYKNVWDREVIAYYTEKDQNYDRVLDIFIRANDGGTKLSKSDLLLSTITAKWQGVSARLEIYDFVEYINNDLELENDIDKDFIMKSCLVLSDLDQKYKVENFTALNLHKIEMNWSRIKKCLEATLRLVNRFGINRSTLSSANALLPIAYYLYKTDSDLQGTTPFESSNAKKIQKWLLQSLLYGVFGGTSDRTIGTARTILQESLKSSQIFPYHALIEGLATRGRITNIDENSISAITDIEYGSKSCFLALSMIYDNYGWGMSKYHVDHIIPRSMTDRKKLMAMNISDSLIERIILSSNKLGNLELLLPRENLEKNDTPFEEWIQTRDREFMDRHLIPSDPELWKATALPEFVRARETLIRQRVAKFNREIEQSISSSIMRP